MGLNEGTKVFILNFSVYFNFCNPEWIMSDLKQGILNAEPNVKKYYIKFVEFLVQ